MNMYVRAARAALIAVCLTAGTAACDNGKAEADKKAAEAAKEAQEAAAKASLKKSEADEAAAKAKIAHIEVKSKLQKDLDAHDRKATYLKDKAAKLTGDVKKNADAAVAELETRRTTAKTSLAKLSEDSVDSAWDSAKKAAEDDIAAVGKAVDSLETAALKK